MLEYLEQAGHDMADLLLHRTDGKDPKGPQVLVAPEPGWDETGAPNC